MFWYSFSKWNPVWRIRFAHLLIVDNSFGKLFIWRPCNCKCYSQKNYKKNTIVTHWHGIDFFGMLTEKRCLCIVLIKYNIKNVRLTKSHRTRHFHLDWYVSDEISITPHMIYHRTDAKNRVDDVVSSDD